MATGEPVGVFDNALLPHFDKELVATQRTHVILKLPRWNAFGLIVLRGKNEIIKSSSLNPFDLFCTHLSFLFGLFKKLKFKSPVKDSKFWQVFPLSP